MNRRSIYISLLALSLAIGACELFGDSDEGFLDSDEGFLDVAGPILFISDETGTDQLYSIQPNGTELKQLTSDETEPVIDADWSPDGKSIVMTSWVGESAGAFFKYLYLVDANGRNRRRISAVGSDLRYESDGDPVWSPDGKQIAFSTLIGCCEGGFPVKVYTVNSVGIGMQKLGGQINTRRTIITDWSDDGLSLLGHTSIKSTNGSEDRWFNHLSSWSLSGESLFIFGEAGKHYSWPKLSSSGLNIAFQINDNFKTGLFRSTRTGTDVLQLADDEFIGIKPVHWSPDDSRILASGGVKRKGFQHLHRMLIVDSSGNGTVDISPFSDSNCRPTSWRTN